MLFFWRYSESILYTDYFHLSYSIITWQKIYVMIILQEYAIWYLHLERKRVNLNRWFPVMHCANCSVVLKKKKKNAFQLHFNVCIYFQNRPDMHFTYGLLRSRLARSALVLRSNSQHIANSAATPQRPDCQLVEMEAPRFILRFRVVCWWLETWSATLHKSEKKRWEGIEELLPASSTKKKKEKGNIFIKPARLLSVDDLDAWGKKKKKETEHVARSCLCSAPDGPGCALSERTPVGVLHVVMKLELDSTPSELALSFFKFFKTFLFQWLYNQDVIT